ncbi:MAG: SH3 domain-containing protein [Rhodospirillaceae bacterium]|nr:SH3 domain-containing protein [Rhodospirillaceae bacterium]
MTPLISQSRRLFRLPLTACAAGLVAVATMLSGAAAAQTTPTPKPAPATPAAPVAQPQADAAPPSETDAAPGASQPALPLPRFVSLRTDPVNLRAGPGVRYPVEWVYMRRRLPVEIVAEFETWRQIRDPDGAEGWVHQSMLSGRRTGMITGAARPLRKGNNDIAEDIATLEPGVVVDVQRCPAEATFCRVEVNGLQGWLKRDHFWGIYPKESIE